MEVASGLPAAAVVASGDPVLSRFVQELLSSPTFRLYRSADVLGVELATVSTTEGAAYGAGLLGAVGAGWFPTVEVAAAAWVRAMTAASPGPDTATYADTRERYRELYPALASTFHRLGRG